jgi:hypothetical protein
MSTGLLSAAYNYAAHNMAVERYRVGVRNLHMSEAQKVRKTTGAVTAQGLCFCDQNLLRMAAMPDEA